MSGHAAGGDSRDRHEPGTDPEPTPRPEPGHTPPHTGDTTVNHGPETQGPAGHRPNGMNTAGHRPDDQDAAGHRPDDGAVDRRGTDGRGTAERRDADDEGAGEHRPDGQGAERRGVDVPGAGAGGRDGQGAERRASDGPGAGPGGAEDGLEPDELALRRLLHSAVEDIEPSRGTLEHLRRAVPARRARKRQAAVGMAAACLFFGTAVPALLHVSRAGGTDPDTSIAGQASAAQGGAGQGKGPEGGTSGAGQSGGRESGRGKDSGKGDDQGRSAGTGTGATAGTGPSASEVTDVPVCTGAQLGKVLASANPPDSVGIVYGTFQVSNISSTGCTVDGPGTVSALALGAADATRISTVRHTAGDAAAALPDPSLEVTSLVLLPGSAYTEKFAFVPSQSCPTGSNGGSGTGGPTSDPSPSQDPGTGGATDTGGTSGTSTQLVTEDGTGDGSVQVSHAPQAGGPVGSTVVPDACAGTVYWTGLLAGS